MDSKLKRLYEKNPSIGFAGNTLKESDINSIVMAVLGNDEMTSGNLSGNTIEFGDGSKLTILTKDSDGFILTALYENRVVTRNTPFYPGGMAGSPVPQLTYANSDINIVDITSEAQVFDNNGVNITDGYSISGGGLIFFADNGVGGVSYPFILVSGLAVLVTNTITITRDSFGAIASIKSEKTIPAG